MNTKKVKFRVDTLKSTYPSVTHNQIVNAIIKWFTERCHQAFVDLDEKSNLELIMARVVSIECDCENITFELKSIGIYTNLIIDSTYKIGGSWIVRTNNNVTPYTFFYGEPLKIYTLELLNCYIIPEVK